MRRGLVKNSTMHAIANAINTRGSASDIYYPEDMPQAILDIPNVFIASDEGKVVMSGSLVAQTPLSVNATGTYDTTVNNSVTVSLTNASGVSF